MNLQVGRYDRAEQMLRRSLALKPTHVAWANLAPCYFYTNRVPEWEAAMKSALELGSGSLSLWANLAYGYRATPSLAAKAKAAHEQAIRIAESMLKINARDPETHAELAWLTANLGQRERALDELRLARELAPGSGAVLFRAVMTYESLGDREQALLAYKSLGETGGYLDEVNRRPELRAFRADPRFRKGGSAWRQR